ncbi:hypothetical protein ABQF26_32715, partial [Mycolicibacterium elephantis]
VLVMAFTLVYTAEHYVVDILLGWVLALVVVTGLNRFEARRSAGAVGLRWWPAVRKAREPDVPPVRLEREAPREAEVLHDAGGALAPAEPETDGFDDAPELDADACGRPA